MRRVLVFSALLSVGCTTGLAGNVYDRDGGGGAAAASSSSGAGGCKLTTLDDDFDDPSTLAECWHRYDDDEGIPRGTLGSIDIVEGGFLEMMPQSGAITYGDSVGPFIYGPVYEDFGVAVRVQLSRVSAGNQLPDAVYNDAGLLVRMEPSGPNQPENWVKLDAGTGDTSTKYGTIWGGTVSSATVPHQDDWALSWSGDAQLAICHAGGFWGFYRRSPEEPAWFEITTQSTSSPEFPQPTNSYQIGPMATCSGDCQLRARFDWIHAMPTVPMSTSGCLEWLQTLPGF